MYRCLFPLFLLAAPPLLAQKFLGFPLSDPSVSVWHGWLYDNGSYHGAVDYPEPLGTPVLAAADGIAMASSQPYNPNNPGQDTYGTFVLLQHSNGFTTLYAHLSATAPTIVVFSPANRYNMAFQSWTPVKQGDVIGFVGISGVVTTPRTHLHFEVAQNPAGTYSGHVANRVDSYSIYNVALFYPPTGPDFTSCGSSFLWTSCPVVQGATYTYTGHPFTYFYGSPGVTGSDSLSASLTFVCPLAPLASLAGPDPTQFVAALESWSITDGVHRLSSSDPGVTMDPTISAIGTDSNAHINSWRIYTSGPETSAQIPTTLVMITDSVAFFWDYTSISTSAGQLGNARTVQNLGTWSGPTGATSCNAVKYTYTGNPIYVPSLNGYVNVTATFTVPAAIASSQSGVHVTPLAWSIGDSAGSDLALADDGVLDLEIWTDAQGQIVQWSFTAQDRLWPNAGAAISTTRTGNSASDSTNVLFTCSGCSSYAGQNVNAPGTWASGPL